MRGAVLSTPGYRCVYQWKPVRLTVKDGFHVESRRRRRIRDDSNRPWRRSLLAVTTHSPDCSVPFSLLRYTRTRTRRMMMPGWGFGGGGGAGGGARFFEEDYHCYSVAYADKAHLEVSCADAKTRLDYGRPIINERD